MWLFVAVLAGLATLGDAGTALDRRAADLHVVAPSTTTAGDDAFTVHVHADTTGDVQLSLTDSQGRMVAEQNGSLAELNNGQKTEFQGKYTLDIPEDAVPGTHTLQVVLSPFSYPFPKAVELPVRVKGNNRIILIQTDKPVYRPGQTISGRVLVLNKEGTASQGDVSITIKDPSSYVMARFANRSLDAGVAKFVLPLSDQPVLGLYTICASYEGQLKDQRECFKTNVDQYVLPTFSCSVIADVSLMTIRASKSAKIRRVCFSVTAEYTYGQKVKGKLAASAFPVSKRSRCHTGQQTVYTDIDGSTQVCIKVCSFYGSYSESIEIQANMTDSNSGRAVQCEGTTTVLGKYRSNVLKILDTEQAFHPCQHSTVTVQTVSATGGPLATNVTLKAVVRTRDDHSCRVSQSRTLTPQTKEVNAAGIATFDFCMPCDAIEVLFQAESVDDSFQRAETTRYFIHSPEQILLTGTVDTLTNSNRAKVGSVATVDASFSSTATADYYVVNKGRIVHQGRCNPVKDVGIHDKHPKLCYSDQIHYAYSCRLQSLTVTSAMQPTVTFIVSQRNLAASRVTFTVETNPDTQISVSFAKKQTKPGDNTTVTVTSAAPSSYVGIVAVDQSVYLQQDKNQLTREKLDNKTAYFEEHQPLQLASYQCQTSWYWQCPCSCYGYNLLHNFELPLSVHSGKCCPRVCQRAVILRRNCSFVSAASYFQASGLHLFGSSIPPPTSCPQPLRPAKPPTRYDCCPWLYPFVSPRSGGGNLALNGPALDSYLPDSSSHVPDEPSNSKSIPLAVPKYVRKYFPETWLWIDQKLNSNETTFQQQVTVPDTITSWIADAFSVSSSTAMSISRPATLRAFKPFFVAINLPYSVTRGEIVEITVSVFNYLESTLTAHIDLGVHDSHFRLMKSKRNRKLFTDQSLTVTVSAGESSSLSFHMLPLKTGHLPIKCTARAPQAADAIVRSLLVEPEGVEEEYGLSTLLCPNDIRNLSGTTGTGDTDCTSHQFSIDLPSNYVPDSEHAAISVTADYMSPTVGGLEKLLRMPTGCGEQNMLKFAPAVYITRYLSTLNELDDQTADKSMRYMQTGYQREMTYQRRDGSYSAFGDHDQCGSMWLTAFVVRSFSHADGLLDMHIDPAVQQKAIHWIKQQQKQNGIFPPNCQPLHKEMQGCSGGDCSLTAYVTVSLLEAGVAPDDPAVMSALKYLRRQCIATTCDSPYTLALVSYTFCKAGHSKASATVQQLKKCAITDQSSSHWEYTKTHRCDTYHPWSYSCRSRSCDVETTGYALLALMCHGDIGYSINVIRWLVEQRNPRGGFRSTQDTVVALQALAAYASLTMSTAAVNATVTVSTTSGLLTRLNIDHSNALQLQTVKVPSIPTSVTLESCSTGCILAQAGVQYNIPEPDNTAAIAVSATAVRGKGACKYELSICNRWLLKNPDSSNMAITDLTLFSGFQPSNKALKQLENSGQCQIKRTEFEGRHLRIYLDEITDSQCCFKVTIKRTHVVGNLQGVPVVTYNYYQPEQTGGTMLYPRPTC